MAEHDLKDLALGVLIDGYLANVAVNDAEGPWVAPVIYIHDTDLNVYWLSKPDRRHSEAIAMYSRCAVAITAKEEKGDERAIQMEGKAERLDSVALDIAKSYCKKAGKSEPASGDPEKISPAHVWYKLVPSKLELIHSKNFGWDRQTII